MAESTNPSVRNGAGAASANDHAGTHQDSHFGGGLHVAPRGSGHHDDHHHAHPSPQARLWHLLWPERRDIGVVIIFAVMVGILMLAVPVTIETLVNTVSFRGLQQPVVVLSLLLFVCLAFATLLRLIQTFLVEVIQRRIFVRVAHELSHRLPRVHAEAFEGAHGPELVNRFFDVMTVQKVAAALLLDGVAVVLQAFIGMLVLAFYHPFLLGFDLLLLVSVAFVVFALGRGAVRSSIEESLAKYAVVHWLEEMARYPMVFKQGGCAQHPLQRAEHYVSHYLNCRRAHFAVVFRQIFFALSLQAVAMTALLGLGGWLVIQGGLTLGQLVAAELIVAIVVGSFAKLGKHMEAYYDLMAAVDKLGHLLDLPLERPDGEGHVASGPADLRLRGVSFAFNAGRPVLEGIDLHLPPRSRLAIVGGNGSGKSTLSELLFGMRHPTSGVVELDGGDLRDIHLDALRQQVALVRGADAFEGTIEENLRVGRGHLTLATMREALIAVGVADEIAALPDGLQTRLTSGGAPLSRGQVIRLALARAIVARPRLLIIDESLEGLDRAAAQTVLKALLDQHAPWTLVLFTHDPVFANTCNLVHQLQRGSLTRMSMPLEEEMLCPR